MKVAILQAYSATNLGDKLLVDEAISLLRECTSEHIDFTIAASYPETFKGYDIRFVRSRPSRRGFDSAYIALLYNLNQYDLVVGVGGGYLRFGSTRESLKTAIVHLPQLIRAATISVPTVYLPQSVGPAPAPLRPILSPILARIDKFFARDDTSIREFPGANFVRLPDMALMMANKSNREPHCVSAVPVVSIRHLGGSIPAPILELAKALGTFEGYIQSTGGGNDDTRAVQSIAPLRVIDGRELFEHPSERRVIVAGRLHAALMAINAGHYAIHLSYERKGYAAFSDMNLSNYVYNARSFNPVDVANQVYALLSDSTRRKQYDDALKLGFDSVMTQRAVLVDSIRRLVAQESEVDA